MPIYTFNILRPDAAPVALHIGELPHDAAAFAKAGDLLNDHLSGDRVEIWDGERPVVARCRDPPLIRSIEDSPEPDVRRSASHA